MNKQKGFTLIELLIVLFILGCAITVFGLAIALAIHFFK